MDQALAVKKPKRRAAHSVFQEISAGSGKIYVLTNR